MMKNLNGPWSVGRHGGPASKERCYLMDATGEIIATGIKPALAREIARLPDLRDVALLCAGSIERTDMDAPEDALIVAMCARFGYGAVMDAAARLWGRKDDVGALTTGPCRGTVRDALGISVKEEDV